MSTFLDYGPPRRKGLVLAASLSLLALGWTTDLAAAERSAQGPATAALDTKPVMGAMHGLFATQETRSTNLAPFKKWDAVLARFQNQRDMEI